MLWASGIKELTIADHRALLDHINFLANREMHNDFVDQAHTEYDEAVRKLEEEIGFAAFAKENRRLSVIYIYIYIYRPGVVAKSVEH